MDIITQLFQKVDSVGPVIESRERGLDFAEPLVDFVGQLVGFGILLFERLVFRLESVNARPLVLGEIHGRAAKVAQTRTVAIREVGRDRDPFPTFGL
jgi:hypothetical protein